MFLSPVCVVNYVVTSKNDAISTKNTDCKSAGYAYGGSNPPAPTKSRSPYISRISGLFPFSGRVQKPTKIYLILHKDYVVDCVVTFRVLLPIHFPMCHSLASLREFFLLFVFLSQECHLIIDGIFAPNELSDSELICFVRSTGLHHHFDRVVFLGRVIFFFQS